MSDPTRFQTARGRQAVTLLRGLRRDFDRSDFPIKSYVAFGGKGMVAVVASGPQATELRHMVEEWGGKVQEVPDDRL